MLSDGKQHTGTPTEGRLSLQVLLLGVAFAIATMHPTSAMAQDDDSGDRRIDSILALITPDTPDSAKAVHYCRVALLISNIDSCLKYAQMSLAHCSDNDTATIANATRYAAWGYWMKDNPKDGLPYLLRSTRLNEHRQDTVSLQHNYRLLSKFYYKLYKSDSVNYYITKAMDINIKQHDTSNIAKCYIDLSEFYFDKKCYAESETNLRRAIELDSLTHDTLEYARAYYRLGEVYCEKATTLDEIITTTRYIKKAIAILEDANSERSIYISTKHLAYGDLAKTYIMTAKETRNDLYADSCYTFLQKSLDYLIEQNDFSNAVAVGYTYFEYYKYKKQYKEGLEFLLRQNKHFNDETPKWKLRDYYDKLREAYFLLGDYKNAYECIVKRMEYADASINDSTMSALAALKTEQAMVIANNNHAHEEELHNVEKRKLRITIILLCIVIALICALVFHISRMLEIKKRSNEALMLSNETLNQQKTEIESQKNEIESQKNEIELQKNIITEQWHEVETVNSNLIHSINYAQRIQRAALSKIEDVKAIFPDSFVFYRPRDIVSGDFYSCTRCGRYAVMITADCTGHGIPGAFLSMLGLSGLKEYMTNEYDAENPGTVLDRMRIFIKSTLVSSRKGKIMDDGMDMTICSFDFEKMTLHYAIASQTAFIIRDGAAIKLRGDIMPVGYYVHENEHFQTLTTPIQKGDMIYTFSDGIQDQIGGPDKRKFLQKHLAELLTSLAPIPADEQCQIIDQTITTWRGSTPQVDDMTLVGIRVV